MLQGLLGRKIGMTQLFEENGTVIPVTVVQAGPVTVVQRKTTKKEGYEGVQVGFEDIAERKVNKAIKGHFKEQKLCRFLKEFRVEDASTIEVGQVFDISLFTEGDKVSITGTTKGRGFFRCHETSWFWRATCKSWTQRAQRHRKYWAMCSTFQSFQR